MRVRVVMCMWVRACARVGVVGWWVGDGHLAFVLAVSNKRDVTSARMPKLGKVLMGALNVLEEAVRGEDTT